MVEVIVDHFGVVVALGFHAAVVLSIGGAVALAAVAVVRLVDGD